MPRRSRPALKALCERLGAKPKTVYLPIRVAVTGSRISPGLYESLELLGRDVVARTAPPRRRARSLEARRWESLQPPSGLPPANKRSRRGVSLVEGARGRRAGREVEQRA